MSYGFRMTPFSSPSSANTSVALDGRPRCLLLLLPLAPTFDPRTAENLCKKHNRYCPNTTTLSLPPLYLSPSSPPQKTLLRVCQNSAVRQAKIGVVKLQSLDLQLGFILVLIPIDFISRSDPIKSRNPGLRALHLNVTRLVPLDGLNRIPARRCIQWRFFPGTGPTEGFMSWVAQYMKCLSVYSHPVGRV